MRPAAAGTRSGATSRAPACYPVWRRRSRCPAPPRGSGQILRPLGGALEIGFAIVSCSRVIHLVRCVLDCAPRGVLIAVAGVLDELVLGLLESFRLAAAGFGNGSLCLIRRTASRRRLRTGASADCPGLG